MRIVVIGGGFAGINFVLSLSDRSTYEIIVVDRNNYNFFPPLLYQVATGFLEVGDISYPFRKLARKRKKIRFHFGELIKIIPDSSKVLLSTGELDYDFLVIAAGAQTNYFSNENIAKNSLPMKTVNDALSLRNHFLEILEQATLTAVQKERQKLLTIVIAGAGPTGVEISGMLAEMKKNIIPRDYPELIGKEADGHIYLVDGAPNVLATMSTKSQEDTHLALSKMGVEIKLGVQVTDYLDNIVYFNNGDMIETKTLVWSAGVTGSVFDGLPLNSYGRGKRLIVDEFNRLREIDNIFAIGDTCIQQTDPRYPNGHPQLAQVAIQQGKHLAANFSAMDGHNKMGSFIYRDKGTMAIIGRNKAVVDIPRPRLHFRDFIAWLLWLFVHLMSLINYRNRIKTFYNWAGAWITKDQSLRMIIKPAKR